MLKEKICTSIFDEKYRKTRWIDLYFKDKDYFFEKEKSGLSEGAVCFFAHNQQTAQEAKGCSKW